MPEETQQQQQDAPKGSTSSTTINNSAAKKAFLLTHPPRGGAPDPAPAPAPSPAPAPAPAPAGGGAWLNVLPQEYRSDPEITRYKDLPEFLKGHAELRKFASGAIRVPGEKATDAERNEFYTKLGWPGGPDKYELKFEDGVPVDEKLLTAFTAKANELHLPKAVVQELGKWWAEQAGAAVEGSQAGILARREQSNAEMQKKWGYAYERNLRIAGRGLANILGAENGEKVAAHPLWKVLEESGVTDSPAFLETMHAYALRNGEAEYVDDNGGPSAEDLQSATEEYNATMNSDRKTSPYWNASLAGHAEAVARMKLLRETMIAAKQQ